jgi:hypothetical protein
MPLSVDDLPTVGSSAALRGKKSWLAKKWERKASPSSSPSSSPLSSPRQQQQSPRSPSPPRKKSPDLADSDRAYTSAPVVSRRNRYSLYRGT